MPLPKQIVQIALGDEYCKKLPLEQLRTNLLKKNPDYTYILLTDADCVAFLAAHFPEHMELYNKLTRVQYKSDLIRYLYIYVHGGYYVDIDLLPMIGFDELSTIAEAPSAFFTFGAHKRNRQYMECANGLFGCEKGCGFLLDLVQEMYADINPVDYGRNVKRMYAYLANRMPVEPFKKISNVYFLEEYIKYPGKYYVRINTDIDVCYSNGHGYPYTQLS